MGVFHFHLRSIVVGASEVEDWSCPGLVRFLLALGLLEICMHKEWAHSSIKQNKNLKGSTRPLTLMFEQPPSKKIERKRKEEKKKKKKNLRG